MSAATRSVRWCRYGWSGPRGSCKRRRPRQSGSCSTAAPASPSDCGSGADESSKRSGRILPKSRRQGKIAVFTPAVKVYSHLPLESPLLSLTLLIFWRYTYTASKKCIQHILNCRKWWLFTASFNRPYGYILLFCENHAITRVRLISFAVCVTVRTVDNKP